MVPGLHMHAALSTLHPCYRAHQLQAFYTRAPAMFRDTVMDTHKGTAAEDFGLRVVAEKKLGYTIRTTSAAPGVCLYKRV